MLRLTRTWTTRVLLLVTCLAGCRSPAVPTASETRGIRSTLERLYEAFSFDAGAEPDWDAQRALFADGAGFVAPAAADATPQAVDTEAFLASFQDYVRGGELAASGYHERIVHARIDGFGGIAHAFVTFEGFVPGQPVDRRGVDSIQLVADGETWLVVSFTTQYESATLPLPTRFGAPR